MEGLAACSVGVGGRFLPSVPSPSLSPSRRRLSSRRWSRPLRLCASSRDSGAGPELDKWEQMELQFGRLIGEDPNLTLAKIMARKANPDVSYLDVEKSFRNNKGRLDDYMINIPADKIVDVQSSVSPKRTNFSNQKAENMLDEGNLNLLRPAMNKEIKARKPHGKPTGVEIQTNQLQGNIKGVNPYITMISSQKPENTLNKGQLSLSRPSMTKEIKATRPAGKPTLIETQSNTLPGAVDKGINPNITLRKPSVFEDDDVELEKNPKLKIKRNIFLKMREGTIEEFSDVSLLKKPEMEKTSLNPGLDIVSSGGSTESRSDEIGTLFDDAKILGSTERPYEALDGIQQKSLVLSSDGAVVDITERASDYNREHIPESSILGDDLDIGLQPPKQSGVVPHNIDASGTSMDQDSVSSDINSRKAALQGRPTRLDPAVKDVALPTRTETVSLDDDSTNAADVDHLIPSEQEERESNDWKRAEQLLHTGERDEVELISCSSRGFVVSFGSLIGFLPYRNLGAKWKFLAFESWLRRKGLEPSIYRQNLSILGSYDVPLLDSNKNQEMDRKYEETLPITMKYEDLLTAYDQEKTKFLSSFIGQKIKVSVILANRNSRKLLFSGRPKENEELVEKKRSLMTKLRVGDIVKCCIKKITYFGIFVEVEGVPALIHQSEVSWDATLDPSSFYKIDQIIEAKVLQLDYALERISLSLREIMPDPLIEALESVVGDNTSMGGNLQAEQADIEWADVESLIKELQQIDGVHSVSKGRFFLSPGLAPTFQVYMASMFESRYKLLARYENKVQEVLVQASLDKEQMKAAILMSTNRVV